MRAIVGQLGRLPRRDDPRTLQLARYLSASTLQATPAAVDWSMREGVDLVYPVLGNDRYGDCVLASACHCIGTWTGQTGAQQEISEAEALDAYSRFAGFRPDDPSTDNGANMLSVATRWRSDQIAGRTIKAFAEVKADDEALVAAAVDLFGGLWTGWELPLAWQSEAEEWTTGPSLQGQWAPRSWGGHAMLVVAVSPQGLVVRTWGGKRFVTWAAWHAYCDEPYALIGQSMWDVLTGNRCPAGIDGPALATDLELVTG